VTKDFKIEFNKNCCLISGAMSIEIVHIGKRIEEDADFQEKDSTLEDDIKAEELEQSKEISTIMPKEVPRE